MKKHLHKLILFSATACLSACTAQEPLTDYVDPRIGTAHSRWFFFTPAAVPFGMAKLALNSHTAIIVYNHPADIRRLHK